MKRGRLKDRLTAAQRRKRLIKRAERLVTPRARRPVAPGFLPVLLGFRR